MRFRSYVVVFVILCSAGAFYLYLLLNSPRGFVELEGRSFNLNGKAFYPVAVNYIATLRSDKNELWPGPYLGYTPDSLDPYVDKDSTLKQLRADFHLIRQLGFNTIRVVGLGEESVNKSTEEISLYARIDSKEDTAFSLLIDENMNKFFSCLDHLLDAAREADLRVILLVRTFPEIFTTHYYLKRIAQHFKEDTVLMAYDLFNEPLYFDSLERAKTVIPEISGRLSRIVKMYAPHQLSTIGLAGVREVFEWDPNLVDVDFLSFHPYDHEPGQVMSELYWYNKTVNKPWIVGETAIPADNDSITYADQLAFAKKSMTQTFNCGGSGYSWWQYKDVEWHTYLANYMGVVTRSGVTNSTPGPVIGTIKPVADAFRNYSLPASKSSCNCPDNYYNWSGHRQYKITGKITDDNNKPIEHAVFLAWNEDWSHSYHTFTKADGSFELYGDFPFYHWIASAVDYSMIRGEIDGATNDTIQKTTGLTLTNLKLVGF